MAKVEYKSNPPEASRVEPGDFVKVPTGRYTVDLLLDSCKARIERELSLEYREQFTGRADHERRIEHRDTVVVVTLTHGCGERFRAQREYEDSDTNVSIRGLGRSMGSELVTNMRLHQTEACCDFQTPKTKDKFSIGASDPVPEIDPKRSLIPEKICPICGPSDWEDECDHDY